ncbi:MAG: hypothetical protein NT049_05850 [Planctomycetota bacterium]|nr:hypothetical protein [Planctomycetota bacterium]
MTLLTDYRKAAGSFEIPETSRAWQLYGAGLENLKLDTLSVPEPKADELLCRATKCR